MKFEPNQVHADECLDPSGECVILRAILQLMDGTRAGAVLSARYFDRTYAES